MDLKIAKIILWPKNRKNPRREVNIKPSGVSVITGWSQRGKSALIHIIDYCLGSERCAIPVGIIREKVDWFGVLLHFKDRQILLGRRNPENEVQSPEMIIRTGRRLVIPDVPVYPEGRDAVISQLNILANLPVSYGDGSDSGFDGPPSFRDLAAFEFLPQHIIANPYTLFFKADTNEHREKLIRSVLPYVVGAVDSQTLEKRAKLRLLEADLRFKREQLDQARKASLMWLGKLQSFYATAQEYNLLQNQSSPDEDWTPEIYISLLSGVEQRLRENPLPLITPGTTRHSVRELNLLRKESERLLRLCEEKRRKLEKLEMVSSASAGYGQALNKQSERLAPSGWFAERVKESHECPLCGSETELGKKQIALLAESAKEIASTVSAISVSETVFGVEILQLEKEILSLENESQRVETRLNQAEERTDQLKTLRNRRDFIHSFWGELKAALEGIRAGSDVSALAVVESKLASDVGLLAREVNESGIRTKMNTALSSISTTIGHYAEIMGVEHSNRRWALDDRNLSLKSSGSGQRVDYLWEIGSAANWMGFHIATLLALHEHFRTVPHNAVPKFLILDQPSQAFFPEGIAAARIARLHGNGKRALSDDLARLKRVFVALSNAVFRTKGGLQVIVLEHADATVWQGVANVHQMGEWRDKDALVPLDWK